VKKILFLFGIVSILILMPVISSIPLNVSNKEISQINTIEDEDYDGTFIGGLGHVYKENNEWTYDTSAYIAGVYKNGARANRMYANIYNLEEEQIGNIAAYYGHRLIFGFIRDMQGTKAPIIGFIFINEEDLFAGRIMSVVGPAPHIYGKFTPN